MTRRERLENKAERLREWAAKREARATAQLNSHPEIRHDWAFVTQPGHIPFRARMNAADDRAHENLHKAGAMRGRAAGLADQLDRSIFSDDPDALEALRARIAEEEAKADKYAAINKAWRKSKGDVAALVASGLVSEKLAQTITETMRLCPYLDRPMDTTNLRANVRRLRERITDIERRQAKAAQAEAAGGCLITYPTPVGLTAYAVVTFAEKPPREVIDALHAAGYTWGGGSWSGRADALDRKSVV